MTTRRVQIARLEHREDGKPRWKLVAHGAPYSREDGESYVLQYGKANIRLLPLPKGA